MAARHAGDAAPPFTPNRPSVAGPRGGVGAREGGAALPVVRGGRGPCRGYRHDRAVGSRARDRRVAARRQRLRSVPTITTMKPLSVGVLLWNMTPDWPT